MLPGQAKFFIVIKIVKKIPGQGKYSNKLKFPGQGSKTL